MGVTASAGVRLSGRHGKSRPWQAAFRCSPSASTVAAGASSTTLDRRVAGVRRCRKSKDRNHAARVRDIERLPGWHRRRGDWRRQRCLPARTSAEQLPGLPAGTARLRLPYSVACLALFRLLGCAANAALGGLVPGSPYESWRKQARCGIWYCENAACLPLSSCRRQRRMLVLFRYNCVWSFSPLS